MTTRIARARLRGFAARLAAACAAVAVAHAGAVTDPPYTAVTPGRAMEFPRDFGSHPDFRTEWWYATGWLTTQSGESLGFQVTRSEERRVGKECW